MLCVYTLFFIDNRALKCLVQLARIVGLVWKVPVWQRIYRWILRMRRQFYWPVQRVRKAYFTISFDIVLVFNFSKILQFDILPPHKFNVTNVKHSDRHNFEYDIHIVTQTHRMFRSFYKFFDSEENEIISLNLMYTCRWATNFRIDIY